MSIPGIFVGLYAKQSALACNKCVSSIKKLSAQSGLIYRVFFVSRMGNAGILIMVSTGTGVIPFPLSTIGVSLSGDARASCCSGIMHPVRGVSHPQN